MIVRRKGGLTEFIPSPREKREGLIRDHVLELVKNLHRRIEHLESKAGMPAEEAKAFAVLLKRIKNEESCYLEMHNKLVIDVP